MTKSIVGAVVALALMVIAGCGTPPGAPTGLQVTSTSPITLSWTAVSGATSYRVYRGTTSGGLSSKELLASSITTTTFADNTATGNTTYFYQVSAVNSDGVSSASNEVSAVAVGSEFSLVASVANSQITLNWTAVTSAAGYNVWRGTTTGVIVDKTKINTTLVPATTTTFTDTAAAHNVGYFYQVTAVDASGNNIQQSIEATASIP
ncbi:MAG TPA: fibronectin type III domain-containing protein [Desulfuromonadaceae bacterium]